jgi:hypothetical protein
MMQAVLDESVRVLRAHLTTAELREGLSAHDPGDARQEKKESLRSDEQARAEYRGERERGDDKRDAGRCR